MIFFIDILFDIIEILMIYLKIMCFLIFRFGVYYDGEFEVSSCFFLFGFIMSYIRDDLFKFSCFLECLICSF